MEERAWILWVLAGFGVLVLLGDSAAGQETTGSISGRVWDGSGAVVAAAKLTIGGGSLPAARVAVSGPAGTFRFPNLPAGTYDLTVSASGFSKLEQVGIPVVLGKDSQVDVRLEVGRMAESLVVTANAVLVDTSSSQSSVTVERSFFDRMPKTRGFQGLVELAPGARGESKAGGIQVDGASGSENVFYLDGLEITDVALGVLGARNQVPVEMVEQVQVKNGVMEAQYGGAMGGVVNAAIRSGTNEFHGQGGFYFDNDAMSARLRPTLEMDPLDVTRSRIRYFQNELDAHQSWNPVIGLGGPLLKNRLYFFAGFMPTFTSRNRSVTFLSDNQTRPYHQKEVQHYSSAKLDYVPYSKVRMNAAWIWNHGYQRGILPLRQGTGTPEVDYAGRGTYSPSTILSGQIDYLASSRLVLSFRGGYNFSNFTDKYALSPLTFIYSTANSMFADIPASDVRVASGWVQQGSPSQDFDIYRRINLNADASYLFNRAGQHIVKAGWQTNRLSNSARQLYYPTGFYYFRWNRTYSCVTTQCTGQQRGPYGYYYWFNAGTSGDASSDNQGIFFQDTWRVSRRLTLNLGLRAEREFLPSFQKEGIAAAPPISFSWGSKLSPRLGGSFDPRGDGKMRIYASWGNFFDVMKYNLPRGAFGGSTSFSSFRTIDDPALMGKMRNYGFPTDPSRLPGRLLENINYAIPSNDPQACEKQGLHCSGMTIEPNLKPMMQRTFDAGFEYSLGPALLASARYARRRLVRTIEDTGTLGDGGEVYFISNPGFGVVADPKNWAPGFPTTPKARRDYDAVELRLERRFARGYQLVASYTWSRLWGNYSGLADSDDDGFNYPNITRGFDLPWVGYTEKGTMAYGRLATDRTHTLKLFGGYTRRSLLGSTTLSPNVQLYSGSPLTTSVYTISTYAPVYAYGRGDMGRAPVFYNMDLNAMHDFAPMRSRESVKIRFEFSVFNVLNSSIVTNRNPFLLHPDDGQLQFDDPADFFKGFRTLDVIRAQNRRISPLYGLTSGFQGPRTARLQLSFFF